MPAPEMVNYAIAQALGMNQQADPVRDKVTAARSALDMLFNRGEMLGSVARTQAPEIQQAASQLQGVSPISSSGGANPEFVRRLQALIKAAGGAVTVQGGKWGYRSNAEQAALYKAKPGLAAPPGRSNHERGTAGDLSGNLALAHRLAAQFGLRFPMLTRAPGRKYEPWHVELA